MGFNFGFSDYFNSNLMGADASLAVAAAQGVSGVQSGGAGAPHQYNPMHAAAAAMYYYPAMAAAAAAQQYISTGHAIAAPPPSTAAQMGGYPSSAASALLQGVAAGNTHADYNRSRTIFRLLMQSYFIICFSTFQSVLTPLPHMRLWFHYDAGKFSRYQDYWISQFFQNDFYSISKFLFNFKQLPFV